MDPVLHQIHENKELFKEESGNISCVLEHLRPWLDLYDSKGHESVLNSYSEEVTLSELVDLLLEARNRVWARVFIETLGSWPYIRPRLQQWAQQLDTAGVFVVYIKYCQCCETDLTVLLSLAFRSEGRRVVHQPVFFSPTEAGPAAAGHVCTLEELSSQHI